MRITRNYRNGLMSAKKANENTSLFRKALSRNSKSRNTGRAAAILGGMNKTNSLGNKNFATTAKTEKFYYDMKYHAGQVCDYGNKLADQGKDSLFAKAKESGSNAEIVANIKGFVGQYNSMLENLRESGTRTDTNYLNQLNSISGLNSSELSACGVTRKSDGTLVVDEKKLEAADLETLEKAWGGKSGFAGRTALWADSVETTAERSMEAKASTSYSKLFNNYGNSGNYFNFFG